MQDRERTPGKSGIRQNEIVNLKADIPARMDGYKRMETVTTTLYDISKAVCSTKNLDELFVSIHQSLEKIIDTRNFSISLYDREKDIIWFAYYAGDILNVQSVSNASQSGTLSAIIINSQKPALLRGDQIDKIYSSMPLSLPRRIPKAWLGVPLIIDNSLIGIVIFRHYDDPNIFQLKDIELLESVSGQIAMAIDRKRTEDALQKAYDEMEENVRLRTMELEAINAKLLEKMRERDKAEEVLRLSEEKFSKAFRAGPSLMSITTLKEGRFIDVNEIWLRVHGFKREDVIGRTSVELGIFDSENRNRVLEMLKHGPVHNLEVQLRNKKGQLIHGLFSADVIMIEDQPCMLTIVEDITVQKQTEKALRESEERYRAIFENAPVGITLTSMDGTFLTVNQAILDLIGYSSDEIQKQSLSALYIDSEARKALLELVNRKGVAFNFPAQFKRKDGITVDTLLTTTKVHQSGGDEVLQSICIDVSEIEKNRKELEKYRQHLEQMVEERTNELVEVNNKLLIENQERKRIEKALRESEEAYRTVIEHSNDGVSIIHNNLHIYANNKLAEMLGYDSPDELIGKEVPVHPDDVDRVKDVPLRRQKGELGSQIAELKVMKKDGTPIFVETSATKTTYKGKPVSLAFIRDITERKEAEQAIQRYQIELEKRVKERTAELVKYQNHLEEMVEERTAEIRLLQEELLQKERLAILGRLIATVAHEIRNPLGTINTSFFSIGAAVEKNEPERVKRSLALAERNIRRCDAIISELLDYTRNISLDPAPVDIDAWIKEVLEEQIYPQGIQLKQNLHSGSMVSIDKEYLRRILINVVTNAIDALNAENANGKELTVETGLVNQNLEIRIRDTGPGIPDEISEKVFEPLFSTKSFGVGLGLTIAKDIMEKHHGTLNIQSEVGSGTTVILRLPLPA